MPFHMTMHKPDARIISLETDDSVAIRSKRPSVTAHRDVWHSISCVGETKSSDIVIITYYTGWKEVVRSTASPCFVVNAIRTGYELNLVTMNVDWMWTTIEVIDHYLHCFVC